MRPAFAFAAGAVLLAITLLIIAPGALLDARINTLSDGRLRIANATGTLWQGSGELVLMPAGPRQTFFWRLDATVRPRGSDRASADRIAMALAALGAPDGRGGYRVIWTGTWR